MTSQVTKIQHYTLTHHRYPDSMFLRQARVTSIKKNAPKKNKTL